MSTHVRSVDLNDSALTHLPAGGDRARRAEILETAANLIAMSGYSGTSLKDIADACGILPGSLYHHFESKEAIVIELVERYQAELESIGQAFLEADDNADSRSFDEHIVLLSTAIAECAVRHRAAVQMTTYEPRSGAGEQLVELVKHKPRAISKAMAEILHRGRAAGYIKPGTDLSSLAVELYEKMLHIGFGVNLGEVNPSKIATTMCRIVLDGAAVGMPQDIDLDRSAAMVAANNHVDGWGQVAATDRDGKAGHVLAVARAEFARRGYEATTVRELASAAGMGTGSVYRIIQSKKALLDSIMGSFHTRLSAGYNAVLMTDSSSVEKFDALAWLHINVLELFPEEFEIQYAWFRAIPPAASDLSVPQVERTSKIRSLISEGLRCGELQPGRMGSDAPSIDVLTMCFRDLAWPNSSVVEQVGRRAALTNQRNTVLRGAADADSHSA